MGASSRNPSEVFDPLDRVRMPESERRIAREYMEQGEAVADFIIGATAAARVVAHGIARGIRTLARTASAHH